jgi:hypothetical protein
MIVKVEHLPFVYRKHGVGTICARNEEIRIICHVKKPRLGQNAPRISGPVGFVLNKKNWKTRMNKSYKLRVSLAPERGAGKRVGIDPGQIRRI